MLHLLSLQQASAHPLYNGAGVIRSIQHLRVPMRIPYGAEQPFQTIKGAPLHPWSTYTDKGGYVFDVQKVCGAVHYFASIWLFTRIASYFANDPTAPSLSKLHAYNIVWSLYSRFLLMPKKRKYTLFEQLYTARINRKAC